MENVLQRHLRTDKVRECIIRATGVTNFENLTAWRQPWWGLRVFTGIYRCMYRSAQKNSGYVIACM